MGVGDEFYVFSIYINRQRYRIFLFPRKSYILRIYEEYWMNEKAFFFIFFPAQKSNEWMTFELFREKEKKENTQKFGKKTEQTFI